MWMISVKTKKEIEKILRGACEIEQEAFKRIVDMVGDDTEFVVIWQDACGNACDGCGCMIVLPAKMFKGEIIEMIKRGI